MKITGKIRLRQLHKSRHILLPYVQQLANWAGTILTYSKVLILKKEHQSQVQNNPI